MANIMRERAMEVGKKKRRGRPRKPSWLSKVAKIQKDFEATDAPFFDRSSIETLFGLGPRQALNLVHDLGSHRFGNVMVVPRQRVRELLAATKAGKPYAVEVRRVERVREALIKARQGVEARHRRFTVSPAPRAMADLPATIRLGPGELSISFDGVDGLLRQLFQLSRAIAADMLRFEAIVKPQADSQTSGPR
jgi:hypothetical protein